MAVKPIPEGYMSITPYLTVDDGKAAIEFYKRAFGATPTRIAFACRHRTRLDAVAQLLDGVQECPDLAEAGAGEVPVVHAGERPQQGCAFQAEEIRQRVLVDHARVDAGILTDPARGPPHTS